MATTFVEYTGDGNATKQFTFPSYQESDVKVRVDGVLKITSTHYNITNYTTTGGGNVVFTSGNIPSSPANIRIYRDTNVDTAKATFTAGSSVKAADLNNNNTQLLYRAQEEQIPNLIHSYDIDDSAITSAKIEDGTIVNADLNASAAIAGTKISPDFGSQVITTTGNIVVGGTVDGRDVAADGTKLDGIEAGATADQSNAEIRAAIEAATDSNVFTDADHTKLNGIETGATADQTNAEIRAAVEAATDSNVFTDADHTKLNGIETGATADQTASDIKTLIASSPLDSSHLAANSVTTSEIADAELTTLAGMQSGTASILASGTALTATTTELNQLSGITLETSVSTNSDVRIPTSKAVNDQILAVTNALGGFVAIANETSFPTTNPDPSNNAGTVVSISALASGLAVNSSGVATISNGAGTGNTVTITGFPSSLHSQTLPAGSGLNVQTTTTLHTYTFHKQLASAADIQAISATVNSFSNRYRVSSNPPQNSLDGGDLWYDTTNSKLMVYSSQNSAWEEATAIGNFFISTISSSSSTGGGSATPNGTAYRFTISNAPTSAAQLIVSVDGVIQKPNSGSSQPSEGYVLVGNDIILGAAPANGASLFVTVIGSTVGIGTPSNNTVTSAILQNGSVIEAKLGTGAVTTTKIADESVTLAKLPHGTSSNNGKFLRANNGADPSFETVDLTTKFTNAGGDTITGDFTIASGVTNKNINIDVSDKVRFDDNLKATFGNGDDLQIFHDGTHTRIYNDTATSLNFTSPDFTFNSASNSNQLARFTNNGSCELYHSGTKRLDTNSSGITVHTSSGVDLTIGTNDSIFRTDANMGGIHFSTTSVLPTNNAGTVVNNSISLGTSTYKWSQLHATTLYGDGSNLTGINTDLVSDTTPQLGGDLDSNGNDILLGDNCEIKLGAGGDLKLEHQSSSGHSYITEVGNGSLYIQASNLILRDAGTLEHFLDGTQNGAVKLYHNGSEKLETKSDGLNFRGQSNNIHLYLRTSDGTSRGEVYANNSNQIGFLDETGNWTVNFDRNGSSYCFSNFDPGANNTYDLGSSSYRWRNIYTQDLQLSNESVGDNGIDGTWGNYTIVEGESDLFLKNNRSGKTYKFNLTEVA